MGKKLLFAAVILIVVLAGAAHYAFSNLDSFVKQTIEKYGTLAVQAEVELSSVHISVSSGEGSLSGLSIANPKGYSDNKAFEMGSIDVKLDNSSVMGNGPVIIKEIDINKPGVLYELTNAGASNLQALQKNVQAYAATAGSAGGKSSQATAKTDGQTVRKVIINDLYVRDGRISIRQPALLKDKTLTAPLPLIHLTNIGKAKNGALPADVAKQVVGAIAQNAATAGANYLAKNPEAVKGMIKEGGASLKGLFGKKKAAP